MRYLLISDLHLQPRREDIHAGLQWFLHHHARGAERLYLLGDIFEYWIGDDAPLPDAEPLAVTLRKLAANGTEIFFQHGNRDFLVGESWLRNAGAELLDECACVTFPDGQKTLLLHGDQLCSDDVEYQTFRAQVRSPAWQQVFLSRSVQQREQVARQLRDESQNRGTYKSDAIMDVNPDTVAAMMREHGVTRLIHGHTHRPAMHRQPLNGDSGERWVLGDWDRQGWYIEADEQGLALHSFPFPKT